MSTTPVAHHFDDAAQQRHAAHLGMWAFIASEALIFAVVFCAYTACRAAFPDAFAQAGGRLYKWIGVANAAVLLVSSGIIAGAVQLRSDRARAKALRLGLAAALGAGFLAAKGVEYALDIREGLLPGVNFDASAFDQPEAARLFLFFYWSATALHALHVLVGIGLLLWAAAGWLQGSKPPARNHNLTHAAGLYWHFVDVIWLFLLPLLYLSP